MDVAQRESNGQHEARPNGEQSQDTGCDLSIPSFASDRCRLVTTSLVRALASIPPADDAAIEDRALACFVVACAELSLMRDIAHRDVVVEQLTIVARKLVKANAATYKPALVQPPPARNPAQGLAEGLMRGLLRNPAPAPAKAPPKKGQALKSANRPFFLDVTFDPPGFSTGDTQDEAQLGADASGDEADAVPAASAPTESVDVVAVAITAAEVGSTEAASAEVAQADARRSESIATETATAEVTQPEAAPAGMAGAAVVPVEAVEAVSAETKSAEMPTVPAENDAVEAAPAATGDAVAGVAVEVTPTETTETVHTEPVHAEATEADQAELIPSLTVDDVAVEVAPQPAELLSVDIGSADSGSDVRVDTVELEAIRAAATPTIEGARAATVEAEPAATETSEASAQAEVAGADAVADATHKDPPPPRAIELKTADAASHAELSWDELESLIRQEVSELATHH
jgi:hypothetical protein